MHARMRDGVVGFALMAVREEQQPAPSGVRYRSRCLVNNALHSLPRLSTLFPSSLLL